MTNMSQIHGFYRKIKKRKFLFFKPHTLTVFVATLCHTIAVIRGMEVDNKCTISAQYFQNYNTINVKNMHPHRDSNLGPWNTVKLCLLFKTHTEMGVNTTIVTTCTAMQC